MSLNSVLLFTVNNHPTESRCPLYVTMQENKPFYSRMELNENKATQFSFYLAGVFEICTSVLN